MKYLSPRAQISINWLQKGRFIDDTQILKRLIEDKYGKPTEKINPKEFESEYNLQGVDGCEIPFTEYDTSLGINALYEMLGHFKFQRTGKTILEWLQSMLPEDIDYKKSIAYAFGRISSKNYPSLEELGLQVSGLDSLSAALLSIGNHTKIANDTIEWLVVLWRYWIDEIKEDMLRKIENNLTIDTTVGETRKIIKKFISKIGVISQSDPVILNLRSQLSFLENHSANEKLLEVLPKQIPDIEETKKLHKKMRESSKFREELERMLEKTPEISSTSTIIENLSDIIENKQPTEEQLKLLSAYLPKQPATLDSFKNSLKDILYSQNIHSQWMAVGIRADDVSAEEHGGLIGSFREHVNFMNNPIVREVCRYLSPFSEPKKITADETAQILGISKRISFNRLAQIEKFLNTTTLIGLHALGMQFRIAVGRKKRPLLKSKGLVEKIHLSDSDFQIATIYIEPKSSQGPDKKEQLLQVVGDSTFFSLRLDLYDAHLRRWRYPDTHDTRGSDGWIYREPKMSATQYSPTQREVDVMSALWGTHEYWNQMKWLLDSLGIPRRTSDYVISELVKNDIITVVHHPIIDYCGLPEGYLLVAKHTENKKLQTAFERIIALSNYCKGFYNQQHTDLCATIRTPRGSGGIIIGQIADLLERDNFEYMIARVDRQWTYYFTVLERLYDESTKSFIDPWI
ncbi:MAG: hypothetical protein BAJATHORv1_40155 [Candidatus Thorarchaeota archaeon]|nr:MAG: hypothetical protein BAJATHORv1_40155 [Candidatus Thorarchaeota archaeon]